MFEILLALGLIENKRGPGVTSHPAPSSVPPRVAVAAYGGKAGAIRAGAGPRPPYV